MAIYQYNRRFFVRDKSSDKFIEFFNQGYESETRIVYNDNELEEEQFNRAKEEYKLPDGYYYYQDPDKSHQSIDLIVETSFNVFFNIGVEEEYKKKEIELRPMYIGYMINDNGDMLFKIEKEKEKLDKIMHTAYTWPLELKTNLLPLVKFIGESLIEEGKGFDGIVDIMYIKDKRYPRKRRWTKFGDPWFIALIDNKGYENITTHLEEYCVRINQYNDKHNLLHSVYKTETFYPINELNQLNAERKAHGRDPIDIDEEAWYEEKRSFYLFNKPKVVIGYDELDPAENVEKYRHKKTKTVPKDIRIDPEHFYIADDDIEGEDRYYFTLYLPYDYYFILKIKPWIRYGAARVEINNVTVFYIDVATEEEYILNSLNQTSSNYRNLNILNFNVELEQGENTIWKDNCSIELEVRLIQGSIDYV